jgi:hypothetical protein
MTTGHFLSAARPDRDEPEIQKTLYPFDLSYEEDHIPEPIEPEDFTVEEFPAHADDAIDEPAFSPDEEIGFFAEEVRQADPAFTEMTVDDDEMSISFSRRARLFGLFEPGYTDVVRVPPGGSVEVDQPWWLGFAVMDDRKTSSDYAAMFENFDQKTGQLFNILGTAMKTPKEMNSPWSRTWCKAGALGQAPAYPKRGEQREHRNNPCHRVRSNSSRMCRSNSALWGGIAIARLPRPFRSPRSARQ